LPWLALPCCPAAAAALLLLLPCPAALPHCIVFGTELFKPQEITGTWDNFVDLISLGIDNSYVWIEQLYLFCSKLFLGE
jgi:hypothetical protein